MTDKTSFDKAQPIVVKLSVGQVKPIPYCYAQKATGKLHSSGPFPKPKEPIELLEDLARFMAYAGLDYGISLLLSNINELSAMPI